MCCPMVRTLLKMRGRGDYSETYGYAEGLGVKTVGFRSNAPAGPRSAFDGFQSVAPLPGDRRSL